MAQPFEKIRSAYRVNKPITSRKVGEDKAEQTSPENTSVPNVSSGNEISSLLEKTPLPNQTSTVQTKDSSFLVDCFNWTLNILVVVTLFIILTQINRKYSAFSLVKNHFEELFSTNSTVRETATTGVHVLEIIQSTTEKAIEPLKSQEAKEKILKIEKHFNKEIEKLKAVTNKPRRLKNTEQVHEPHGEVTR